MTNEEARRRLIGLKSAATGARAIHLFHELYAVVNEGLELGQQQSLGAYVNGTAELNDPLVDAVALAMDEIREQRFARIAQQITVYNNHFSRKFLIGAALIYIFANYKLTNILRGLAVPSTQDTTFVDSLSFWFRDINVLFAVATGTIAAFKIPSSELSSQLTLRHFGSLLCLTTSLLFLPGTHENGVAGKFIATLSGLFMLIMALSNAVCATRDQLNEQGVQTRAPAY